MTSAGRRVAAGGGAVIAVIAALFALHWAQIRRERRKDDLYRPSAFRPTARNGRTSEQRSAGCAAKARKSPVDGEEISLGDRSFLTFGPRGYDAAKAWPVVVVLHGWHTDARHFAAWFEMQKYVGDGAFVVYPSARESDNGVWDVHGDRDTAFVAQTIESVADAYCIDTSRVLALGFSFGAKLAYHLGCTRPDVVKAIAVGDGSMGGSETGCGTIPLLASHRPIDHDELFEWGTGAFAAWTAESGCTNEADVADAVHSCSTRRGCRAPATFCQDDFVNPVWPDEWNHTIRAEYRALAWDWFVSLP